MRYEFEYLKGNDGLCFPKPGEVKECRCGICDSLCVVERNVDGPTSWAESMAKRKHLHDAFRCPHYGSEWHNLALDLIREMGRTASERIRALVKADLDELLAKNLPGRIPDLL
jgi:hypothetical protein